MFLDNFVVLQNSRTIQTSVSQGLQFVAPMIKTNSNMTITRKCDLGWNMFDEKVVEFPTNKRSKIGWNFQLLDNFMNSTTNTDYWTRKKLLK